jgi:hypothetical protein
MKPHHHKDYKKMRSVVLWLHDEKCFLPSCGSDAEHVHHNDHDATNNDILNLIPLCERCHRMAHRSNVHFDSSRKQLVVLLLRKISKFNI